MISLAYAALWVFVFCLPWERIFQLGELNIVTRITGALALGIALFTVVISGRVRRVHLFHIAALLFWIWAAFCLFFFSRAPKLPDKLWTYFQLILVLWMIWELAPSIQRLRGLMLAYVLGAYVAALDTIRVYQTEGALFRRFAAGGADPNDLAMVLAIGLPMAWYLGMTYQHTLLRWLCRAYLPLALVAVGLSGSRGGMLATMVALLVVPLTMTRLTPARLATAVVMLGLGGGLAIAYTPETLIERFATTGSELGGGHVGGRGKIWRAGFIAFTQRPFIGYGPGGFMNAISPITGGNTQVAHNSFLSVLVEQGIIGFAFFMTMFVAVLRAIVRLPLLERRFALVLFCTVGTAMLPLTWEHRKVAWFSLAILLGFAQAHMAAMGGAVQQLHPSRPAPAASRSRPVRRPA